MSDAPRLDLTERSCSACHGGSPKLTAEESEALLASLSGWRIEAGHHLVKEYRFDDFAAALAFTNQIGALAEDQGHHPEITLGWGSVKITLWTFAVDGLSENDFVLAAHCDKLPRP